MDRFDDVSVVHSVDESPPAPRVPRGVRRAFTVVVASVVVSGALAGAAVGLVLPGFITTEGFPQSELTGNRFTRRLVSTPERGAQAIVDAGLGGKAERYVPRPYALAALARVLAPRLVRRATSGKGGGRLVTKTGRDDT